MSFTDDTIQQVWGKGQIVAGYPAGLWRKDQCNAWIGRDQYGMRNSLYGWEIDHITPVESGGGDFLNNLRPLHWENNASKQDGKLTCSVTSQGNINIKH